MGTNILTLPDNDHLELLNPVAREFREEFEELTQRAEGELSGRQIIFSRYGKELYPYFEESDAAVVPGCIFPIIEGRPVASVDSTCVLVGQTSDGALYAARTAVGISKEGSVRNFFRLGPILVYASASGLSGMRSDFSSPEMALLLADHQVAERVIRNKIERRVIDALLSSEGQIIVIADGSLRHPFGQFSGGLFPAGRSDNCLVGLSKWSELIFSESAVGSLTKARGAAYHQLQAGPVTTVLAKFNTDGLVFRVDVANGREPVEKTLGRILWNDSFAAGYPESLKAAHHLSIFSKADDQALKAFVTKKFRLRQLPTFTLRTITLGSFKGGA